MGRDPFPIRVLLVDDHQLVLWGLRKLIEGEWPRMVLAGTAGTLSEAFSVIRARKTDVVVLDLFLGEANSLDYMGQLIDAGQAAIIVLTGSTNPEMHRRALERGASAVVLKDESAEKLLHEIERAMHTRFPGESA